MGLRLNREKKTHLLLSLIYRLDKVVFLNKKFKFKLYLDLEWIFNRLAHEYSFKIYSETTHPIRKFSNQFILDEIKKSDRVMDLGCKYGDITKMIGKKAGYVLGIDHNLNAITLAKSKYKKISNIDFVHSEAYEYLEKNKDVFDVLILSHIIEHLDNPVDFLIKYSAFFKRIYIEVPDFDATYLNCYRKDLDIKLKYTDNDHIYEFDRDELQELINSCNLVIDRTDYRFGVQKVWCSHIK
jgi:SAM-dependent methyltransferase